MSDDYPRVEQATAAPGERRPIRIRHVLPPQSVCQICGAVVMDPDLHDDWHANG